MSTCSCILFLVGRPFCFLAFSTARSTCSLSLSSSISVSPSLYPHFFRSTAVISSYAERVSRPENCVSSSFSRYHSITSELNVTWIDGEELDMTFARMLREKKCTIFFLLWSPCLAHKKVIQVLNDDGGKIQSKPNGYKLMKIMEWMHTHWVGECLEILL